MTERDKFMRRIEKLRRDGLAALGFVLRVDSQLSCGDIFAALNEVEEAIESGGCIRHSGWIGNEPAGIFN